MRMYLDTEDGKVAVKSKIKKLRGGKSTDNFLALPPLLQEKLKLLRMTGGFFASVIENRYVNHGQDHNGRHVGHFKNSGGMWEGFGARIRGKQVQLDFTKYSFPSGWATKGKKRFSDPEQQKKWVKRMQRLGYAKKIDNRWKALACLASDVMKGKEFIEPSKDEVNAIFSWLEVYIERNLWAGKLLRFDKKQNRDRHNIVKKALPDPIHFDTGFEWSSRLRKYGLLK